MHCEEYEVALYDKIYELKHSKSKFDKGKGVIYDRYINHMRKD